MKQGSIDINLSLLSVLLSIPGKGEPQPDCSAVPLPRTHEAGQSQECLIRLKWLHPLSLFFFQKPAEEFTTEHPEIQPNSWPTRPRLDVGSMGA